MYLKELILSSAVSHQICFFALFLVESLFLSSSQEFRDQGFTRPKVLIVVPLRNSAYRIVSVITSLLAASEQVVVVS